MSVESKKQDKKDIVDYVTMKPPKCSHRLMFGNKQKTVKMEDVVQKILSDKNLRCRGRRSALLDAAKREIDKSGHPKKCCEDVVVDILRRHRKICVCVSGHPVLHAALKLCFEYKLDNSKLVSDVLLEVYEREKTFERLFAGAIFGTRSCYLICDWKSDYRSKEENIEAVAYFLHHANNSRAVFGNGFRLQEVEMKNVGGMTPLDAAVDVDNPQMVRLLVGYEYDDGDTFSLLAICRRKVRWVLWSNWELPSGIWKLPLPVTLLEYLERDERVLMN